MRAVAVAVAAAAAALAVVIAAPAAGCKRADDREPPPATPEAYPWRLPDGFAPPRTPADNPMSTARVELGRRLFYDERLSYNGAQSCASCHRQDLGFADGEVRPRGSTGQRLPRNAPGLVNVAYFDSLTWVNPLLTSLERQIVVPMFSDAPIELGMAGHEDEILARLAADPDYPALFARAFPEMSAPIRVAAVVRALACFVRSMISADSPYDRYLRGDAAALSPPARRGLALFASARLKCAECHAGPNLSVAAPIAPATTAPEVFFNMGLYDTDGAGAYPADNRGRAEMTGVPADVGRMRVPSLRNVAVTAPYFHDGSAATLDDVIDVYARGGREPGRDSPLKDPRVAGFELTAAERADLLAFLASLTDETFLRDPRFADPG